MKVCNVTVNVTDHQQFSPFKAVFLLIAWNVNWRRWRKEFLKVFGINAISKSRDVELLWIEGTACRWIRWFKRALLTHIIDRNCLIIYFLLIQNRLVFYGNCFVSKLNVRTSWKSQHDRLQFNCNVINNEIKNGFSQNSDINAK